MLTNQEIFFKVRDHMLKQNAKATKMGPDGEVLCMYRTAQGATCAVGCLITPKSYSRTLEGLGVNDTVVIDALLASDVNARDLNTRALLDDLQMCHDGTEVSRWADRLEVIGRKYGLIPIEP